MIIDGRKMAEEIRTSLKDEVRNLGAKKLRLAAIQVGSDPVTEKFLEQKTKLGLAIGVEVRVYKLPNDISTNALRKKVSEIVHMKENTAVIIQLPLPVQVKTSYILDAIIPEKDADMLSSKSVGLFSLNRSKTLPPVVGAIKYIFENNNVEAKGKNAVVVGAGRLVGKPVALWLMRQGATVTVCDEHTKDINHFTKDADIIISGVGKSDVIGEDMVRNGVIAIDAGASESVGKLVGDMANAIAQKAAIFTPVPGGIGPLTIAMLFANVIALGKNKKP